MKAKTLLFFFLSVVVFNSCKKEVKPIPPSPEKELTSFQIRADVNADFVQETITGTITGTEIKFTIPELMDATKLIASFTFNGASVFIGSVKQESGVTPNDFTQPLTYVVIAKDGSHQEYTVKVEITPLLKNAVPQIFITTENGVPIDSKDDYVKATIKIDGAGLYKDYEGKTSIKGRGNTTWYYPKKPYRLKLDTKSELLGLSAEKDWILLANYLDPSLMINAVAFKTAQLLNMPFTNHIIPVDVTVNGVYQGNYMFTEQKEAGANRINIGDDGWLLEMDTNYDEDFKFHSAKYNLPVMIHNPELDEVSAAEAQNQLNAIKSDFENMEQLVFNPSFPNNNYLDYFDATSYVNYLLVYTFVLNEEINHPKSTYLYKLKGGKYSMGPVWDFDWGFGYEGVFSHFVDPDRDLFWTSHPEPGTEFLGKIIQDPVVRSLYKKTWNQFKTEKYPKLLQYIDDYAAIIKDSYLKDYAKWQRGNGDLAGYVQKMKTWMTSRVAYMDSYTATW